MGIFKGPNITTRADKISNFTVATAEYGSVVQEILGTTRISGNVIYYDDFTAHEHRETHRAGKGGGGKQTTITYTYTVAIIIGLCEGQIKNIGKVWIGKNIYTYPHADIQLNLYSGTAEQKPWPYLISKHPEKALSYPNLAYMAGVIDLGSNASMPNFNFEVMGKLTETGDGIDVNPADYILYVLQKVGFKGEIKGIENYRAYCKAADFLISSPSDDTDSKAARDIVNEIARLTNAYMFWSNDSFKIVPREDRAVKGWLPNKTILYDLTPDDFIEQAGGMCVSYSRKDSSELYNRFSVEFLNRANGYEKETVSYEDVEDIKLHGVKQASTVGAHYIYTKNRAVMLAESVARRNKYERNKYTFKLGWAFARLEPGDLVTLTDPNLGLEKTPVMIDSLVEGTDGTLTFTAISRPPGDYGEAHFDVHELERPYVDFNFAPGDSVPAIFQPNPVLMHNDNEVWIGAKSVNPYWGGCNVWVSNNNTGYKLLGRITTSAIIGNLAGDMLPESSTAEVAIDEQLISGTKWDAEHGNTLLWCDGENFSYAATELLENGNYKLNNLVRGQYKSEATAHKAGAQVVRCDDALLKPTFLNSEVGTQVFFKFTSFNVFGGNEQSLADVAVYPYTIQRRDATPPDVKAIDCTKLATGTRQFWWGYDYPEPNDVKGFELRYNQGTSITWDTALPMHTGVVTEQPFETQALRQGVHTVLIKAVDNSGNYSKGMATVVLNLGDPLEDNVLYKVDIAADGWGATSHNGVIDGDGYMVSRSNVDAWNSADSQFWLQAKEPYWSERYQEFCFSYQTIAPASGNFWLLYDIEGPAKIMYRIVGKDTYWKEPTTNYWRGTEAWGGWVDTKEMLKPYTGKTQVKAGDTIQVFVQAPNNMAEASIIRKMVFVIDVPDREEHFENIKVPLTGLTLPIKTPYYYTTAVRIDSVQSLGVDVSRAVIEKKNPCVIKLIDSKNQPVTATVDVTWQGFIKELI